MKLINPTTNLIDLTKSQSVIVKLPEQSRNFDGSTTTGYGPVNASGMSSGLGVASGGSSIYGSGSYGSSAYGESLELFGEFINTFSQYDPALIECIQKGFNTIFKEV